MARSTVGASGGANRGGVESFDGARILKRKRS